MPLKQFVISWTKIKGTAMNVTMFGILIGFCAAKSNISKKIELNNCIKLSFFGHIHVFIFSDKNKCFESSLSA